MFTNRSLRLGAGVLHGQKEGDMNRGLLSPVIAPPDQSTVCASDVPDFRAEGQV